MVKVRHEFGFDEPHPRHGRVCVEESLEYAVHVLNVLVLPLHFSFFDESYTGGHVSQNLYPPSNKRDEAGLLENYGEPMNHSRPFRQKPQKICNAGVCKKNAYRPSCKSQKTSSANYQQTKINPIRQSKM